MNNTVLNYLEGYFGGELNESTSDQDIIEAFDELLETANAVEEFMEIQEMASLAGVRAALGSKPARKLGRGLKKATTSTGRALVSPTARKIYKGTTKVVADTAGSVGKAGADVVSTAFNSTRTQTGI